jgi:lipopolysaccharide exporter
MVLDFGFKVRRSSFVVDVFTLSSGTAIAQAIMIGILPILSRLYTPEEFGVFTLFVSIATLVSVGASLSFESMIMLARLSY